MSCSTQTLRLAKRLLARGLQIAPNEAIAWFNLGIGLHQQGRIAAAVRAYRHCLALPHNKETDQAARNNLAQDLLLLGQWQEGWDMYAQRFSRKPGNHPHSNAPSALATEELLSQNDQCC